MPRWNTQTVLAGVDFSSCRATILGGSSRASDYVGSTTPAADSTPHRQRIKTGGVGKSVGRHYGVNMPTAQASLVLDFLAAVQAADNAGTPFRVQMVSAVWAIDELCWPDDGKGEEWITMGQESEGIIEDVNIFFTSVAAHTP